MASKDLIFVITLVIAFVLVLLLLGVVFYKFLFRASEPTLPTTLTVRPSVLRQEREKGSQKNTTSSTTTITTATTTAAATPRSWRDRFFRRQPARPTSMLPSATRTPSFQPMQERPDPVPVIVVVEHPSDDQGPPSYMDHRTSTLLLQSQPSHTYSK